MKTRNTLSSFCLGLVLIGTVAGARAATLSYTFDGIVVSIHSSVTSVEVGDPVSGTFIYDNQAPVVNNLGDHVFYGPAVGGVVHVGTAATWMFSSYNVLVQNRPGFDEWVFSNFSDSTGETLDGTPVRQFLLSLVDLTAMRYNDASLPPTIAFADFDNRGIQINAINHVLVNAQLTALSQVSVPVPASLFPFLSALLGVRGFINRGRHP